MEVSQSRNVKKSSNPLFIRFDCFLIVLLTH